MSSISSVNYSSQITKLTKEYEEEAKALPPEEQRLFRQAIAPLLHQMRQELVAMTNTSCSISVIQGHFLGFVSRIQTEKNKFFAQRKITLKAQSEVRTSLKAEAEDLEGCAVDFGKPSLSALMAKAHAADDRVTHSLAASVMASLKEGVEEAPDKFDALSHAVARGGLRAGMLTARIVAIPFHIAGGAVSFVAETVTPAAVGEVCKAGFNKAVALAKKHAPECVKDAYHGVQQMGSDLAERYDLPADETAQFKKDATALVTVGVIGTAVKAAKVVKALKKTDPHVIEGTYREVAARAEGVLAPTKKLLEGPVTLAADDLAVFSPLSPTPFVAARVGASPALRTQTFAAGGAQSSFSAGGTGSSTPAETPSGRPTAYYRPVSQGALEKALQKGHLEVGQRGGEYVFKEPTGREGELVLGLSQEVVWTSRTRGGLRRNIPLNERTLTSIGARGLSLDARVDLEERLSALAGRPIKVEDLPDLPPKTKMRSMPKRTYVPTIRAKASSSPSTFRDVLREEQTYLEAVNPHILAMTANFERPLYFWDEALCAIERLPVPRQRLSRYLAEARVEMTYLKDGHVMQYSLPRRGEVVTKGAAPYLNLDEVKALTHLGRLPLQHTRFPTIHGLEHWPDDDALLLHLSHMKGDTLSSLMEAAALESNRHAEKVLHEAVRSFGRSLREVHAAETRPFSQEATDYYCEKLLREYEIAKDESWDVPLRYSIRSVMANIEGFQRNPGYGGFGHGDAHPVNVIYHPDEGISLIDVGHSARTITSKGHSFHHPLSDFFFAVDALGEFSAEAGLSHEIARSLRASFLVGYGDGLPLGLTPESIRLARTLTYYEMANSREQPYSFADDALKFAEMLGKETKETSRCASIYTPTLRAPLPLPKFGIIRPPSVVETFPKKLRITLKDGTTGEFTADLDDRGAVVYESENDFPDFFFHVRQVNGTTLFVDTSGNSIDEVFTYRFMQEAIRYHYPHINKVLFSLDEGTQDVLGSFLERAFVKVTPNPLPYGADFEEAYVEDTYFYAAGTKFDAKTLAQQISAASLFPEVRRDNWLIRHADGEKTEISSHLTQRGRKIFHSSGDVAFETEKRDYQTARITFLTPEFDRDQLRFHYDAMSQAMQRYHADAEVIEFVIDNDFDEALNVFCHLFPRARAFGRDASYLVEDVETGKLVEEEAQLFTLGRVEDV